MLSRHGHGLTTDPSPLAPVFPERDRIRVRPQSVKILVPHVQSSESISAPSTVFALHRPRNDDERRKLR
jgi:hypothetical protein